MKKNYVSLSFILSSILLTACGTVQLSQKSNPLQTISTQKSETFSCTGTTSSLMNAIGPVDELGISQPELYKLRTAQLSAAGTVNLTMSVSFYPDRKSPKRVDFGIIGQTANGRKISGSVQNFPFKISIVEGEKDSQISIVPANEFIEMPILGLKREGDQGTDYTPTIRQIRISDKNDSIKYIQAGIPKTMSKLQFSNFSCNWKN